MIQLGFLSAAAALGLSLTALALGAASALRRREDLLAAARNAVIACSFFTTLAAAGIVYAFLAGDYQMEYVWSHSDRTLPLLYKIGALWGGMAGSLLFWAFLLSIYATLTMLRHRRDGVALMGPAISVIMAVESFFLALVMFVANPWKRAAFIPPDGQGLNPLLQHPAMVIHPPCLYLGFVGLTIPFAFAMAALISRQTGDEWLKRSRLWALVAWTFLAAGNILGARWAYVELGWGGYWAWDPVENAAFMPWLAVTAFVHSAMIQERKGMLKMWNVLLVTMAFLLTILGTFITRSGMISSVHSFAQSDIGPVFAGFLGFITVFSVGLLIYRRSDLRSEKHLESFFSRESSFLLNNLILLGGAVAVLWGTLFPMVSEAAQGVRISVGPPFFNQIMIPIGLTLLALMGIGPLIAWRRATLASLRKAFTIPVVLGLAAAGALLVLGVSHAYALVALSLSAFVLSGIVREFVLGVRARRANSRENALVSFLQLFRRAPRRFGGYVIHAGVVLVFIGFAGAAFNQETDGTLAPGESMDFHGFRFTHEGLRSAEEANVFAVGADVVLSRGGGTLARLFPQKNLYRKSGQQVSEVAIHGNWGRDLYLVLADYDLDSGKASLKAYLNPLVAWFWIGGIVMVLGGLLVMLPLQRQPKSTERRAGSARSQAGAALLLVLVLSGAALGAFPATDVRAAGPETAEQVASKLMDPCPECKGKQLSGCECKEAQDAKAEIQRMLDSGMTGRQVVDAFVSRYGQWILAAPEKKGFNLVGYLLPFGLLAAGGGVLALYLRRAVVSPRGSGPRQPVLAGAAAEDRARLERELRAFED